MNRLANAFLESFCINGVLHEWMQHIRAKADASAFSSFILECMSDPENNERRAQYTAFSVFIKSRTWPEVAEAISPSIPADDHNLLKDQYAETFYNEMRAIVTLQIQDYWRQFMEQAKNAPAIEVPNLPSMTKPEIIEIVKEAFEGSMKDAIEILRKEFGEDWKRDSDKD